MEISRRAFFKGAVDVAGAAALAATAANMVGIAGAEEADDIEVTSTVDCDIVIVGAGMGGLCAALAAAESGLNAVLLEKLGYVGGTSMTAEGMFGCRSYLQLEMGYDDDTDAYFEAIEDFDHWTNNPRICRRWLESAGDTVNWVMDHGVTFRDVLSSWSTVPTWRVLKEDSDCIGPNNHEGWRASPMLLGVGANRPLASDGRHSSANQG